MKKANENDKGSPISATSEDLTSRLGAKSTVDLRYLESVLLSHRIYADPEKIEDEDRPEAVKRLRKAAQNGQRKAMYLLAINLSSSEEWILNVSGRFRSEESFYWLQQAAELGEPGAQLLLAYAFVDRGDLSEALKWFAKAAMHNYLVALDENIPRILAAIREQAEEISQYWENADAGDAEAQYQMGHIYIFGQGVDPDAGIAQDWWKKAADQGHSRAQSMLADMKKD